MQYFNKKTIEMFCSKSVRVLETRYLFVKTKKKTWTSDDKLIEEEEKI